ncbi:hypothetical protein PR202_gb11209 [Eleusine coracana subsp. coracana]|uniref:Uncharacterized protein n=1 Tax=Eleusine coracana subsp. coracana TaxID=191504 RepID=A0AAV5EJM8_ELECO|nr:hypothetical protein PR202_gb11209 [Eleusine coracana subsp. coracana]
MTAYCSSRQIGGVRKLLRNVLRDYCNASGQQINLEKSSIHFAKGCNANVREEIKSILDICSEVLSEKYLGMPTDVGKSVHGAFKYLKDRVWKRVQGWMEQCLSAGGKEVLIKSIAQAIPTYSMLCFKLPRGLCKHIDKVIWSFWWGSKEGKRRVHWVAWEEMIKPKYMGSLGFQDTELFNLALLAKKSNGVCFKTQQLSAHMFSKLCTSQIVDCWKPALDPHRRGCGELSWKEGTSLSRELSKESVLDNLPTYGRLTGYLGMDS